MKLQFHQNLQRPQTVLASRVVIYDAYDNPIAVAVEIENGVTIAETIANPVQFHSLLRTLGITQTVILQDAQQRALPTINIDGK